jgi:hypothetical protein
MNNSNDEIKSSFSKTGNDLDTQWRAKFNELCFEVFYNNPQGRQLLAHLENKHFRSPVAYPNKEPAWAYFNEGQNEMLRSFTAAINDYMMNPIRVKK